MTDNLTAPLVSPATAMLATDDIGGVHFPRTKLVLGADGVNDGDVSTANPLPVAVLGSSAVTGPLTNAELRAADVPVSIGATVPVSGPMTNAELRASAVPVSGPVTNAEMRATALPVSVSGMVPVSAAALPLPSGAATEATLAAIEADLTTIIARTPAAGALTDTQLRATAVPVSGTVAVTSAHLSTLAGAVKAEDSAAVSGDSGIPMLAMRQLADSTSTDNDGDYTLIKIDEEGRVKVATKPASFAIITGNITANTQTVSCDVSRASNVMISMVAASLVGHNVTFEGSIDSTNGTDGNWFGIQVVRSSANTIELVTGVLAATPAYAWEASVNGLSFIRVRATAHTSGTATWKFQRGSYATEPIPAAQISGTQPVSGTVAVSSLSGTSTVAVAFPTTVADVASAAITTTTTTAAFTPTFGVSLEIVIPVTAVSGTSPTLDVVVQESDDSGTNWFDVWHFPRITATGIYRSPKMALTGNRVRYVQTLSGTTPSFTRAINRLQSSDSVGTIRQLFDRTANILNGTLNTPTGSINVQNCRNLQIVIASGTITTTPPALQIEGTDDGANWYAIGAPLTAGATNTTVQLTVANVNALAARARVSTAGVSAALNYVLIKGF